MPMKRLVDGRLVILATAAVLATALAVQAGSNITADPASVVVQRGTATFDVATNVSVVDVHGKSNALKARGRVRQGPEGVVLEQIEATLPVKSLTTGLGLRDSHMRKYIFTTSDGQLPDLQFSAPLATCSKGGAGQQLTCPITGDLRLRGTTRPFTVALKVSDEGDVFRVRGDGVVKLSAYGIERPSQFGVETADAVTLHFDFTAKQAAPQISMAVPGAR